MDEQSFYVVEPGEIELNAGRTAVSVEVANTGDRPVQVGSHAHFFEVNRALRFDRRAAFGLRLDIPAGTAVRFEPGDTKTVALVAFGGRGLVSGMNGLVQGTVSGNNAREDVVIRAAALGFET